MARIMAIDYGLKRVGLATTDPLQIIASALQTVDNKQIDAFLNNYLAIETVETIVVGLPARLNGDDTHITKPVRIFAEKIKKKYPHINVILHDERFTSKIAQQAMISSGMSKKDRQQKGNLDMVAATVILQSYLEQQSIHKN